jgi:MFS family permease
MVGELLAAVGTVALWFGHRMSADPIVSGYIIIGGLTGVELFWSMSNIGWSALISDLYPQNQRGRIQGRLASMGGIGRMIGVWIGGLLYSGFGLRYDGWGFHQGSLFFIAAGVMVVSILPLFLLPEGGISIAAPASGRTASDAPHAPGVNGRLAIYLVFLCAMTLVNFGRNSIAIIFPQYLTLDSGLAVDSLTLSHILNTQSAAIICFGWAAGWLCTRLGRDTALFAGAAAAIIALLIVWLKIGVSWMVLSSFLRGVGDAVIMAAAYESASIYIPASRRAAWFSWFNATFFLSWGIPGTLLVGPLLDFLLSAGHAEVAAYRIAFAAAAGLTFAGISVHSGLCLHRRRVSFRT